MAVPDYVADDAASIAARLKEIQLEKLRAGKGAGMKVEFVPTKDQPTKDQA